MKRQPKIKSTKPITPYKAEGLRRMAIRKKNRLAKFTSNREFRRNSTRCPCCGRGGGCDWDDW